MQVSELHDRSFVSKVRVKENGDVCVIPRERDELCYYMNHEVLVVEKERGEIVQGRCIHVDETEKKLILLCGDGKESMYRSVSFEEIATVRGLERMLSSGGQRDEILEEKQVVILDYRKEKGYLVMDRDGYESEESEKKVCYYLPCVATDESVSSKKEYHRYDYPATVRVSVRNGELQKNMKVGEGIEKQDRSNFFPAINRRRGYGLSLIIKSK